VAGDRRSELLHILLAGHDEADLRAARVLREAGFLEERQHLCVALARSVDPTEMLDVARARRMAEAIQNVVAELGVRRVIDLHDNKVTMIFAAISRDSGWTAPRASLAKRIHAALTLVGNAALIGVSNDVPSTSHIPGAFREADSALAMASVSQRVVQFAEIPLRQLLLHFGVPDLRRVLPSWVAQFHAADDKLDGALAASLRAYARFDMNILKAAYELGVHPNTLYARFERIHEISGLQPRSFNSLHDLLIVCDCGRTAGVRTPV
jgi:sugar diacid utilization regulator